MKTYMLPAALRPNEYDVRRNPDLARTYRMIAAGGRDAFYDGPIAKTIDAYFKRIGGWLSADDLREHHAEWVEPLVTKYRGVDVYGMPANTQGPGDAADAQHDRELRHARLRISVRAIAAGAD
jgi:gamma-glutamyltranspeptidase / glutathione hydrolase